MGAIAAQTIKVPGDLNRGNGTVAIGDSITIRNGLAGSYDDPNGFFTLGSILSGGRVMSLGAAGVSGQVLSQMQARLATDVIALKPAKCLILGGTNDVATGVALASSMATMTAMIATLRANRIEPILCTIPPRNSGAAGGAFRSQIAIFNANVRAMAQKYGCHLLDFHTLLADPVTGQYKTGASYSSDNVHPDVPAEKLMAGLIANSLALSYPFWTPWLTNSDGDPSNLLTNGCFATDTNADGVANGWTAAGSGGTAAWSLVAGTGGVLGNWQTLTVTAATSRSVALGVVQSGNWNVGDTILFSGRIQTTIEAGSMTPSVQLNFGPSSWQWFQFASDIANGVFAKKIVIPVGATQLTVKLVNGATGTGTVAIAQWGIQNLTTLGLA